MSWWNAKYKNGHGEYEITFASKDYEKTKAVEKFCQAIIDKKINAENAADVLELLIKKSDTEKHARWEVTVLESSDRTVRTGPPRCSACGYRAPYRTTYCPNCGAKMVKEKVL